MSLPPGTRVGSYEIMSALGAGGMGEVYRATDTKLKRQVAIKILPSSLSTDRDRLARFQREAEVLASLNHPNIAAIYTVEGDGASGVGDGLPGPSVALVMELVEGDDLSVIIARGPVPLSEALSILRQIADALEAAHEHGIVHRDLKPANVKVRADGTLKVLDFGLAKALAPEGSGATTDVANSPTITSPAMTALGMILGTAAYMSPEQTRGRTVDTRADVWAFGAVFYELLTGKRAFPGEDITDTMAAVVKLEPRWEELPADVPARVRQVLRLCLQKDPKLRLADIRDVRLALEGAFETLAGVETMARAVAPQPFWRRVLPVALAAITGAVLVGAAMWSLRPTPSPPAVTRFAFPLAEGQAFTNMGRTVVALSPDGARMAYVANRRLFLRSLSELDATAIQGTEVFQSVLNPVFSPDGQSVAFFVQGDETIKRIAITGGTAVTICAATNLVGMSWGPDGIVFGQGSTTGGGGTIMRVPPTGGTPEVLVRMNPGERIYGAQLLPDGRHVLFAVTTAGNGDIWSKANIVVQSIDTQERKVIVEGGSDPRYLPTGHVVYALGATLFAVAFDADTLTVSGGPVPLVEGVRQSPQTGGARTGASHFAVSDSGALIYVPGVTASPLQMSRNLALIDRKGVVEPLKLPTGPYSHPRVSPDGRRIAFVTTDEKETYISVYDLAGGTAARRLTFGGKNQFPIWSADGTSITFQSDRDGDLAIFRQLADGTGAVERLTRPDAGVSHIPSSWSPNDGTLLFSAAKVRDVRLWTWTREGRKEAPFGDVTSTGAVGAVFSPDGRWVAYSSSETGRTTVYVQPFPPTGAKYQLPANGSPHHQLWSPDGKELFYNPRVDAFEVVAVKTQPTLAFGNPIAVPRPFEMGGTGTFRQFDITPGSRFVGLVEPEHTETTPTSPEIQVVVNWAEELKTRVPGGR